MNKLSLQINKEVPTRVDAGRLVKLGEIALKMAGKKLGNCEATLILVSPQKIRTLNKKYRKKDKVTDVLSFGLKADEHFMPDGEAKYLGDIMICPARAKKQAKEYNVSFDGETERLFVHGLLHLLGYEHKKTKEGKEMQELAEKILQKL